MSAKFCFTLLACFAISFVTAAQENSPTTICSKSHIAQLSLAKITVADPSEDDYDVHYVKFDVQADNTSPSIAGSVLTKAKVVATAMSQYVFELDSLMVIDSMKFNNTLIAPTRLGKVARITLPNSLLMNTDFTVQVFYHGIQAANTGFIGVGLRTETSPTWNTAVTFTLSESYASRDWWPCKQSLTDKIDSADIWITVPANLKGGSNGLLRNIATMPNGHKRYEWKTRYPIDYYLLSLSVAPYVDYSYYLHFSNSTDSMLVQNYVYDNPQTLPFWKNKIDSVGGMIDYISTLFGRYPFWKEKYGHCMAPINGGIEHQTMTTLGNFGTTLTAHELGHQWWGDNVTCGTWKDIWLNEGFASYVEYLYVAHFRSAAKAFSYMEDYHTEVMQEPDGSVYVDDTTDENRIFDSRLTYKKGASVIHTLRSIVNNDNDFFLALQTYQQQYKSKTATTEDFKSIVAQTINLNLDTFFNQWIYKEGYPAYQVSWNQVGNVVYLKLTQTTSKPTSVATFSLPVEFLLGSPMSDTIVRVYNNQPIQTYTFIWDKPMDGLVIDPNDWIVNQNLGVTKDFTLSAATTSKTVVAVFPNPAKDEWTIQSIDAGTILNLFDINGRKLWSTVANNQQEHIPASRWQQGIYFLKLSGKNYTQTIKLIKE